MRKLMVANHVTLDGVMQAPARADEDPRDGFPHGGWAIPNGDPAMVEAIAAAMGGQSEFLFGRRTYEDFYAVWPGRTDNPFTETFDNTQKYVASTTLREPLPWINSTVLSGDAASAVSELKQSAGPNLVVFGSGELVRALMGEQLVDQFVLMIHPLVFGTGRRLFAEGGPPATLQLIDTKITTTGVVIATYDRSTDD
jgi:dihydrofolate reductase